MTTPVSHGYPDYGRANAQADTVYEAVSNAVISSGTTGNILFVGDKKALFLWLQAIVNNISANIQFYADAAGTTLIDSYIVDVNQGCAARQPIPVIAPYVRLSTTFNPGPTATYSLVFSASPQYGYLAGGNGLVAAVSYSNTAVLGGANLDTVVLEVCEGPAFWNVRTGAVAWSVQVEALDIFGVATILDQVDNGGGGGRVVRPLYLPPRTIRVHAHNSDAGAQNFTCFLTRKHNN